MDKRAGLDCPEPTSIQRQPYAARGISAAGSATYARKSLSAPQSDLYYRIRFQVISQATNTVNLLKFRTAANASIVSVSINPSGQLAYRNDVEGRSVNSTVSVSQGIWHTLTARVHIADPADQIEIWYDDTPVTALSRNEAFGTNPIGILQLGENTPGLTYDVAFDDVIVSLPRISLQQLRPHKRAQRPTLVHQLLSSSHTTATMTNLHLYKFAHCFRLRLRRNANTWFGRHLQLCTCRGCLRVLGQPNHEFRCADPLRTDASPDMRSYLRFTLQGITGTVRRATLRVFANSAATSGINIYSVSDNTWTESTINYNNAPLIGNVIGSFSPVSAGAWISIDITAYIIGNGTYNLALTTPGSTAISFTSRQAGGNAPQLIIETTP